MLKFQIVSHRTVLAEEKNGQKAYVAYSVQIRRDTEVDDPSPAIVERRYTHFQQLYNDLKKDFPADMSRLTFPKKVLTGNFDKELIETRRMGFEAILVMIASESRLRDSAAAVTFFQQPERLAAKKLMEENQHNVALNVLENSFKLLNKVYTDSSLPVLCTLCRMVGCASRSFASCSFASRSFATPVERWVSLALRRYESVSDADLLMLYAPLLQACIEIWEALGRDKSQLEEELSGLRKRGMKVDGIGLIEAVDRLESQQTNTL